MAAQDSDDGATITIACLSSERHDCAIRDHLLHYLGCLEFCERKDFFSENSDIWKSEVEHQKALGHSPDKAQKITEQKRETWKGDCINELKRISFLRYQLYRDEKDKHLVEKQEESLETWRNSSEYIDNIRKVSRKRRAQQKKVSTTTPDVVIKEENYDLEKDISIPIIQLKDGKADDVPSKDVWNKFPDQKTTLKMLLHGEDNLLHGSKCSPDNIVRYFHIPSNNMKWVEEAIGRYFDEKPPDYHGIHLELGREKKTKTYMILRDQFWRGQLHGSQPHSPAHTRHMTPLCTTISSDPENIRRLDRNMVLFMPYLHWEASAKRETFAIEIDEIMAEAREKELNRKAKEKANRGSVEGEMSARPPLRRPKSRAVKVATMDKLLALMRDNKLLRSKVQVDDQGRIKTNNPLGQLLLDAARLHEGMSNYRDKKLLRTYLSTNPPLHPRRTLDQAYHWSLNSTWERDRDQVVYRHTTAKPEQFHEYDPYTNKWEGDREPKQEIGCEECRRNIQKLSRVVMVDQLWMWILDAKTIITCFPKRYGSNKHDLSAVHKSIRVRIQDPSANRVRTAFDLGLIIIDECANALFNQAGVMSSQPQIIDAFSRAIGTIMHRQTIAFGRLWRWADNAREVYRTNGHRNSSELHMALLDITPEGKLEREIKDVMEELDIMIHITNVQKKMLTQFISNAESLLDPFGKFGGGNSKKRKIIGNALWEESDTLYEDLLSYRNPAKEKKRSNRKREKENKPPEGKAEKDNKGSEEGDPSETLKRLFKEHRNDHNWFKLNADELLQTVNGRIDQLQELRNIAYHTAESIKDLLGLKQQQAGVVQAWQAVRQSDETNKQGQSIMMFTLVTIIFLPLSFMSSVFGMNNMEITSETWSIQRELLYMFTISAGVIIFSLLLAFGSWIRAGLYYLWKICIVTLIVCSGLYNIWRDRSWSSKQFHQEANAATARLKVESRKLHLKHKIEKRNKEEEAENPTGIHQENTENRNALGRFGLRSGQTDGHTNGHSSESQNGRGLQSWVRRVRNRPHRGEQSRV
ncbi:uncharacterized protein F4812DRAFT_318490 [Daldinia caldariorum]|uniref:uncharacterized protein n=1 Tax=Daldinia caldariorum TaxID=326644 RepID=UPI002008D453|nr:uncharacterized protein F4812DRAFT_318490 [Daldinia caldariorum]KAI1469067.1 hypothetical protein F4812DRAFT_318490 [Daldinia caldariorum]